MAILEKKNENLVDEKMRLGVRAAIAFDELTPRYDGFETAFQALGIPKPKPDYQSIHITSTRSYILALFDAIRNKQCPNNFPTKKISSRKTLNNIK